jgi:hypothetical protein
MDKILEITGYILIPILASIGAFYAARIQNKRIASQNNKDDAESMLAQAKTTELLMSAANMRITALEKQVAELQAIVSTLTGKFLIKDIVFLDKDNPRVISSTIEYIGE